MVHNSQPRARRTGWARRRALREQEFLEAAMELFVALGPEMFTLQLLAEKTESAVGAVYRYFPSKQALLVALQRRVLSVLDQELRAECAKVDDPLAKVLAATRWYAALPEQRPREFHLLSAAIGDPRELVEREAAREVFEAATPMFTALQEMLADAAGRGALHPGLARERAIVLWAALHGVLQIQKLTRVSPLLDGRALAPHLVRDLLRGWGATDVALTRAARAQKRKAR